MKNSLNVCMHKESLDKFNQAVDPREQKTCRKRYVGEQNANLVMLNWLLEFINNDTVLLRDWTEHLIKHQYTVNDKDKSEEYLGDTHSKGHGPK
jgi:hypothetical protein